MVQVHLWIGVGLGLYVLVIGVTGAALVFRQEMENTLQADTWRKVHPASSIDVPALAKTLRRRYPQAELSGIYLPTPSVPVIQAYIERGERSNMLLIDPGTGRTLEDDRESQSFLSWVGDLHFNLLSGRTGRLVNGVGALFLLALCFTGAVIWWPGIKRWKKSLKVDPFLKWKRVNWDLHSAVGFWTLAVLSMWAVTGAYFAWPNQFRSVINLISPVSLAEVASSDVKQKSKAAPLDLSQLIASATAKSPGGKFSAISFPSRDTDPIRVYVARGAVGDFDQMDYHYFDQFTGRYLGVWQRGINKTSGDAVIFWIGPVHFGSFGGQGAAKIPVKILWVLLGLAPPTLFVSGFLMYWNRFLSKRYARWRWRQHHALPNPMPALGAKQRTKGNEEVLAGR